MSARRISYERLQIVASDLSPRDLAILEMVGTLRLASSQQLLRAFWPTTGEADGRAARRTLIRLTRWQVLARLERRRPGSATGQGGSESLVYTVGLAGQRLRGASNARSLRLPGAAMWHHALLGAETYTRLVESLRGTQRRLDTWHGEPHAWQRFTGPYGEEVLVKPDAYVRVVGSGYVDTSFVEIDGATQSSPVIRRKAEAYIALARSGVAQPADNVFPRVVFIAETPERQEQLRRTLVRLDPTYWPLFTVGGPDDVGRLLGGGS